MNLPASWRALGRLTRWALLIPAGLFVTPAGARASCGDYVVMGPSHAQVSSEPEHPVPVGQLPPAAPRPHQPCSGPLCAPAPVAPLAPVPTPPSQTLQEWGCILDGLGLTFLDPTGLLDEQHLQRPVHIAYGIFHPPRFAS